MTKRVNICGLKKFAFTELSKDSILREILLSEHDELETSEFIAKSEIWLKLARGKMS